MDVLKEASQLGVNLYEEHQRFVQSFHPKWRADENVMLLLSAIALFTPERSNVLHKDVVKLEQVLPDLQPFIFYQTNSMRKKVKKTNVNITLNVLKIISD